MYFRFGFVQYTIVLAPASEGGGTTKFTSDLDSTLSSLPLYDGGLYERFGHDVYVHAEKSGGGEAPSYYSLHLIIGTTMPRLSAGLSLRMILSADFGPSRKVMMTNIARYLVV